MSNKERRNPMEYVWITFFVLTFVMFLTMTLNHKFDEGGGKMLIFSIICALMYFWRRQLRKNENKKN